MSDTFDASMTDSSELPPLTAAIRDTWPRATGFGAATDAVAFPPAMRKILDAVRSLEDRVIALEGA